MFGNVQPNFDIVTTPLFKKAVKWWEMYRPCAYTYEQHLKNPTINQTDETSKKLAREIARNLKRMGKS